ncbi:MAG: energy transducer TonB [Tunicatimonas sp.]
MKLSLSLLFLTISLVASGQRVTTVRIVDQLSEEPLKQASVRRVTDTTSATANAAGYLQIDASPGDSLLLTAPGYLPGVVVVPPVEKFQAGLAPTDSLLGFEGGMKSLYKQIGNALRYPHSARSQRLQGVTYTMFTIDEAGNMTDFQPLTSRVSSLHKEVIRTLKRVKGRWNPAYQGQNMTLPVIFEMKEGGENLRVEVKTIPGRLLEEVRVVAYSVTR